MSGDSNVLRGMKLGTAGTAAQFIKVLEKVPPMEILNLCKPELGAWLGEAFLQQADDFDFIQNVLTANGEYPELNPTLGAVNDAFIRRKVSNRFKSLQHSFELDRVRHSQVKDPLDTDNQEREVIGRNEPKKRRINYYCRFFQRGSCHFDRCRFRHVCSVCNSSTHGSAQCTRRPRARARREESRAASNSPRGAPPNPRTRRDRAAT